MEFRSKFLHIAEKLPQNHNTEYKGLEVILEWPKGTVREGTDKNGKKWRREMKADYGYIPDTTAAGDKEGLDVYLGPNEASDNVYIIEQGDDEGDFDEYKVMLGFDSLEEAEETYLAHYPEGWEDPHVIDIYEVPFHLLFDAVEEHQEKNESTEKTAGGWRRELRKEQRKEKQKQVRQPKPEHRLWVYDEQSKKVYDDFGVEGEHAPKFYWNNRRPFPREGYEPRGYADVYRRYNLVVLSFSWAVEQDVQYVPPAVVAYYKKMYPGFDVEIMEQERVDPRAKYKPGTDPNSKVQTKPMQNLPKKKGDLEEQPNLPGTELPEPQPEPEPQLEAAPPKKERAKPTQTLVWMYDHRNQKFYAARGNYSDHWSKIVRPKHLKTDVYDNSTRGYAIVIPKDKTIELGLSDAIKEENRYFPEKAIKQFQEKWPGFQIIERGSGASWRQRSSAVRKQKSEVSDTDRISAPEGSVWDVDDKASDIGGRSFFWIYNDQYGARMDEGGYGDHYLFFGDAPGDIPNRLYDKCNRGYAVVDDKNKVVEVRVSPAVSLDLAYIPGKVMKMMERQFPGYEILAGDTHYAAAGVAPAPRTSPATKPITWLIWISGPWGTKVMEGGGADHWKFCDPEYTEPPMPRKDFDNSSRGYAEVNNDKKTVSLDLSPACNPNFAFIPSQAVQLFKKRFPGYKIFDGTGKKLSFWRAYLSAIKAVTRTDDTDLFRRALNQIAPGKSYLDLTPKEQSEVALLAHKFKDEAKKCQ